jgi:tyrosyl-DNA phosphodiesterase 2
MNYLLTPAQFDASRNRWHTPSHTCADVQLEQLTLATFNVWFGESDFQTRAHGLLDILQQKRPDVIGLQEVTPDFLRILLAQKWVQNEYWVSDVTGITVDNYGVLMLGRLPAINLMLHDLPSHMGRRLLAATFTLNGEEVTIATVHLESLDKWRCRQQQLQIIFNLLDAMPHAVLMGDFNFDAEGEEKGNIPGNFTDIWRAIHPHQAGYTKDSEVNTMRWHATGLSDKVRLDQMIVRSGTWQPQAISRLGMKPIAPNVFPSDHFGLWGQLWPL